MSENSTERLPYTVKEAATLLHTPIEDYVDGEAIFMPLTSAIPGTFEATDQLGQFLLSVRPEGNETRRTTRFVVRIERMD